MAASLSPDILGATVNSTMRLVADVYDNSTALDRNNTLSSVYLESQKVSINAEQRKSLSKIDSLRTDIRETRSRNVRMNIVVKMLCVVAIIIALFSSALVLFPASTWQNPKIRDSLSLALLIALVVVFAWYANKFIKNLVIYE